MEAADLDQALALAALCPAEHGGVEVRPVLDTGSRPSSPPCSRSPRCTAAPGRASSAWSRSVHDPVREGSTSLPLIEDEEERRLLQGRLGATDGTP